MTTAGYEYDYGGTTIRVAVHCGGDSREPRVQWEVSDRCGKYGYVDLRNGESTIRLERGETVRLAGEDRSAIPVPREIAEKLHTECEDRGTIVVKDDRVATDPAAFPSEIAGFDRVGWEADRNVMWYARDGLSTPRAYQIEDGELVFRAQAWAADRMSKQQLSDRCDLSSDFSVD